MSHKVQQHVVLADPDIIEQLGCVVDNVPYAFVPVSESTALPTTTALHHPSGWSFYSFHRSILSEHEVVRTAQRIKVDLLQQYHSLSSMEDQASWLAGDQIDVNGFKLHLPPMFFAGDLMLLKSPKDKKMISVSPMDAMQTWAAKHTAEECTVNPLQVPKVPYANKWMAKLAHEFGNNDSQPPADHVFQSAVESADGETPTFTHIQASDWTLSSDYCFSLYPTNALKPVINVEQMIVHREILRAQTLLQSSSLSELVNKTQIEVASSSGIDFNMLRRRDLPILFYDELTLYEDDLEDCGEVSYDAKIRVMPTCWFILMKFYVRIDHVIVRCRETRLYHQFAHPLQQDHAPCQVHMEVTWREQALSMEDSIGSGNPAASSLMRTKYGKDQTTNLPMVNEKYNIPQYYTITL